MKKNILYIVIVLLGGWAILSCKNYKHEYYGPELGVAQNDFSASALTVSNSNPNFNSQTVYFRSTFNARVRWKITLVGNTSGAMKFLTGVSNKLDVTNCVWDGSTDTLKQFRKTETVTATLTVLGWTGSLSTTLTVGGDKYRGYVLGTFEGISVVPQSSTGGYFQDATGIYWFYSFETNELDVISGVNDPGAPQGTEVLNLVGHDANTSYFIGQSGIGSPGGSAQALYFGANPPLQDFYFNFYAKGSGTASNEDYKLVVQVFENDDMMNGIQYDNREDKYTYPVSLNYEGWKLFRIKYSDFILDPACQISSISKVHNPDKIYSIGFFFGANTSAGLSATRKIAVEIDFLSITTDGPMKP